MTSRTGILCASLCLLILPTLSATATINAPVDLDGDGKSEIVWRHGLTGATYLWTMSGYVDAAGNPLADVIDTDWKIAAIDDFDGDGDGDLFWRHALTGENYMHIVQNGAVVDQGPVNETRDVQWNVMGTGDLNGDGNADLLWRHACTHETYIYLMNGKTLVEGIPLRTVAWDWLFIGTADLDKDGTADIIWHRPSTSLQVIAWIMSWARITREQALFTYADRPTSGAVMKAKRLPAGDTLTVVLLRRTGAGRELITMRLLLGTIDYGLYAVFDRVSDLWRIAGTGDYNGDGTSDVLWRHWGTGANYMYLMPAVNAGSYTGHAMRPVSDQNWQIVP